MHVNVDLEVCGSKRCKTLKNVMVDTGSTFTTITEADADEIGIPFTVLRKFDTAKDVSEFPVGSAIVRLRGKEMVNPIIISKAGRRVIGVLSLESLGFKVNPVNGRLEDAGMLRA